MFTAMFCIKHLPYNDIVCLLLVLRDGITITWALLL